LTADTCRYQLPLQLIAVTTITALAESSSLHSFDCYDVAGIRQIHRQSSPLPDWVSSFGIVSSFESFRENLPPSLLLKMVQRRNQKWKMTKWVIRVKRWPPNGGAHCQQII